MLPSNQKPESTVNPDEAPVDFAAGLRSELDPAENVPEAAAPVGDFAAGLHAELSSSKEIDPSVYSPAAKEDDAAPHDENSTQKESRLRAGVLAKYNELVDKSGSEDKIDPDARRKLLDEYNSIDKSKVSDDLEEVVKGLGNFAVGSVKGVFGSLPAAVASKVFYGPEAANFRISQRDTLQQIATDKNADLSKYLNNEDALKMKKAFEASGTYDDAIPYAVQRGPGLIFKDYAENSPEETAAWAKGAVIKNSYGYYGGAAADDDFQTSLLRAVLDKADKAPDTLTDAERKVVAAASDHVGALEGNRIADRALSGVSEGLSGGLKLVGKAISRTSEAYRKGDLALGDETFRRLAADQRKEGVERRGSNAVAEDMRGDIAHAASLIAPENLIGAEALSIAGKSALGALRGSRLAAVAEATGALGVVAKAFSEPAGGFTGQLASGTAKVIGKNTKGRVAYGLGQIAAGAVVPPARMALAAGYRLASAYPETVASLAAQALGFGGLAEIAGEDHPLMSAVAPIAGHLAFGGIGGLGKLASTLVKESPAVPGSAGLGDLTPTGFKDTDASINSAYRTATPAKKLVIENIEKAKAGYNAAAAADPSRPFMQHVVFKTAGEISAFADAINARAGEDVIRFDPDSSSAFTTTKPLPGDFFGDPRLKGRELSVSASFTDSPVFEHATYEEIGHTVEKATPAPVKEAVTAMMTPADREALLQQGVPKDQLKSEFFAQQAAGFFANTGMRSETGPRQYLASFLAYVGGGKAADTVGTRGLQADKGAMRVLANEARSNPSGPLGSASYDRAGGPVPEATRFVPEPPAPDRASPEMLAAEASYSDPANPWKVVAAKAVKGLGAHMGPESIAASVERVKTAMGKDALTSEDTAKAVSRARELMGVESIVSEKQAKADSALERSGQKRLFDNELANAKFEKRPVDAPFMDWGKVTPEEARSSQDKASRQDSAVAKQVAADRAKAIEKAQSGLDAKGAGQFALATEALKALKTETDPSAYDRVLDGMPLDALNEVQLAKLKNQKEVPRKLLLVKAELAEKTAGMSDWNAELALADKSNALVLPEPPAYADSAAIGKYLTLLEARKQRGMVEQAKLNAADLAKLTPDVSALEQIFPGKTKPEVASIVSQASETLLNLFTTSLSDERKPLLSSVAEAIKKLPEALDIEGRRAALVGLAQNLRSQIMKEQGRAVVEAAQRGELTHPNPPDGLSKDQWKAVIAKRGQAVLTAEADTVIHRVIRRALGDLAKAEEINAAVKASIKSKEIPKVPEAGAPSARDEAKAEADSAEAATQGEFSFDEKAKAANSEGLPPGGRKWVFEAGYNGKPRLFVEQGPSADRPQNTVVLDIGELAENNRRILAPRKGDRIFRDGADHATAKEGVPLATQLKQAYAKLGVSDPFDPKQLVPVFNSVAEHFNSGFTPSGFDLATRKVDPSKAMSGLDPFESAALMTVFGENYSRRTGNNEAVRSTESAYAAADAEVRAAHGWGSPQYFGNLQKNAEAFGLKNVQKQFTSSEIKGSKRIGDVANLNRVQGAEGNTLGMFAGTIAPKGAPAANAPAAIGSAAVRSKQEEDKRKASLTVETIKAKR